LASWHRQGFHSHFLTIEIYSTTGGRLVFAPYPIPAGPDYFLNVKNARLLGFLPLPFAQAYSGPTAVFINELSARGLERATNGQIIRRCQRSLVISCFGTENGVSP
jgi:hypothetical protein